MPTPLEEHEGHKNGDAVPSLDGAAHDDERFDPCVCDDDDDYLLLQDVALPSLEEPVVAGSGEEFVNPGRSSPPSPSSLSPSIDALRRWRQRQQRILGEGPRKLPSPNSDSDIAAVARSSGPLLEKMQRAGVESARRAEARETLALGADIGRLGGRTRPRAVTGPPAPGITPAATIIADTISTTKPRTTSEN